jgi:serine/threonine protein kinase
MQRELVFRPIGTFVVRRPTGVDDDILRMQLLPSLLSSMPTKYSISDDHIIISVRVDESIHKCLVMHYSMPVMNQLDIGYMIEFYDKTQKMNSMWTMLRTQYFITDEKLNTVWNLYEQNIDNIQYVSVHFESQNNAGCANAIYHSTHNDSKIFIKRFRKKDHRFDNELNILKICSHFSVASLYGIYSTLAYNHLVVPYNGTSLFSFCPIQCHTNKLRTYVIANIGFQVATGMLYLEQNLLVHRDLWVGNILVDVHGFVHIIDFGHSIIKNTNNGPLRYRTDCYRFQINLLAPECLSSPVGRDVSIISSYENLESRFTTKSDIWSYGLLLVQLMIARPSLLYRYSGGIDEPHMIYQYVKVDRNIHQRPQCCPLDLYLLLKTCWAYNAADRTTFGVLREKMWQLALTCRSI